MFHTWFWGLHHHNFLGSIDIISSMLFPQTKDTSNDIKSLLGNISTMNNVKYTTSFITRKKWINKNCINQILNINIL